MCCFVEKKLLQMHYKYKCYTSENLNTKDIGTESIYGLRTKESFTNLQSSGKLTMFLLPSN